MADRSAKVLSGEGCSPTVRSDTIVSALFLARTTESRGIRGVLGEVSFGVLGGPREIGAPSSDKFTPSFMSCSDLIEPPRVLVSEALLVSFGVVAGMYVLRETRRIKCPPPAVLTSLYRPLSVDMYRGTDAVRSLGTDLGIEALGHFVWAASRMLVLDVRFESEAANASLGIGALDLA